MDTYNQFKDQMPDWVRSEADFELYKLRHSTEHIFNQAVEELYPGKVIRAMGPAIAEGWYNDSHWEVKISEEEFEQIEARMQDIIKANLPFVYREVSEAEAREMFKGNKFKQEFIDEFVAAGSTLSVYYTGEPGEHVFVDLCRGPHVERTGQIKAFKLLNVAGAYWRGDEKNEMLTRVYGTTFPSQPELDEYIKLRDERLQNDHRKLGKDLDLFFIDPVVGSGLPMWTPRGEAIRQELITFSKQLEKKYGHEHVSTPYLGQADLYKTSGHLDHYQQNMYAPIDMDGNLFYLRPMACPHHIRMYQRKPWSYKDLPIRYAEVADYNRFEKSGELSGMIRVRKFQLTDAHIFVTPEGLKDEFKNIVTMIIEAMTGIGIIDQVTYRFSQRDPEDKEKYYPDENLWEKSQSVMKQALDELGIDYYEAPGEAAFYGPKLDIQTKNVHGKEDTILTAQMDFLLPEKFDLDYVDANGQKQRPVMIHRSAIGALERTFAFLLEKYKGAFPVWMAPEQVRIIPISDENMQFVNQIKTQMLAENIRVEVDTSEDRLGNKIRKAQSYKVPYMIIVGKNEVETQTLSVRLRSGEELKQVNPTEFIAKLTANIRRRDAGLD